MSATPAFASSTVPSQRVAELSLRTVLEQLPVALMRLDAAGTLLAVNDAALGLLGATSLDLVLGTSFLSWLPDEDARPLCAAFLHDAAHGLRASRELTLRSGNGELHVVEMQAVPYPGGSDQTPSVTVTLRDVSRTHALTQSLIQATERHAQLEQAHVAERERWDADQATLARAAEEQSALHETRVATLESELAAARDEARRAREAWSEHEAIKREADRRRQHVEDAVTRLAVEIGLLPPEPATPNAAAAADDEVRSAW